MAVNRAYNQLGRSFTISAKILAGKITARRIDGELESTPESRAFISRADAALQTLEGGDCCEKEQEIIRHVLFLLSFSNSQGEIHKGHLAYYARHSANMSWIKASQEQLERAQLALCIALEKTIARGALAYEQEHMPLLHEIH